MPRLDAERLTVWRALMAATARVERAVGADLVDEFDITLEQFEVLGALQRAGGSMRIHELTEEVAAVHSSLVRRVDRMEDSGWVERRRGTAGRDGRAVTLILTRSGRDLWRDANVAYRRSVQMHFARHLTETDLSAVARVIGKIADPGAPEP